MQRSEFIEAAHRAHRRNWVALAVALTLMACYFVILALTMGQWTHLVETRFRHDAAEIIKGLSPLPAVIILFASIIVAERKNGRDPRLVCRHCRKRLDSLAPLVIASGNCPHCGEAVLEQG